MHAQLVCSLLFVAFMYDTINSAIKIPNAISYLYAKEFDFNFHFTDELNISLNNIANSSRNYSVSRSFSWCVEVPISCFIG